MRAASGTCQAFAQQNGLPAPPQQPWTPPLAASATGGPGAGQNVNLNAHAWPPAAFAPTAGPQLRVNALPSYIPNATPITMTPGPTPTAMAAGVAAPDGWFNAADTVPVRPSVRSRGIGLAAVSAAPVLHRCRLVSPADSFSGLRPDPRLPELPRPLRRQHGACAGSLRCPGGRWCRGAGQAHARPPRLARSRRHALIVHPSRSGPFAPSHHIRSRLPPASRLLSILHRPHAFHTHAHIQRVIR